MNSVWLEMRVNLNDVWPMWNMTALGSLRASFLVGAWLFCEFNAAAQPVAPAAFHQGLDLTGIDKSVAPGDDFFDYVNGKWLKSTDIPPDKAGWGTFYELAEETTYRTKTLIEETVAQNAPPESLERKISDYYTTFLNTANIESQGTAPLQPALLRIAQIQDHTALARVLGEDLRTDVDPLNSTEFHTERLFGAWVAPNLNDPRRCVVYLLQGGLGLPDREYYLSNSSNMAELRAKYETHIANVLRLAGIADEKAKAARIMALEMKIAELHTDRAESQDVRKANNPWKRTEFAKRAPGLEWETFFRAAEIASEELLIVWHPRTIRDLSALTKSEPLGTWRDFLAFHAIEQRSDFLPQAFVEEHFAFYGKTLSGTPQLAARFKRGIGATNDALGDAVGQLYVKKYFPPAFKAQVEAMVKNIRVAFAQRIDKLDWMSRATKLKAKAKLATLYVGVGYPEHWIDYTTLQVTPGDAVGNAERAELFAYKHELAKLRKPADSTDWAMTPQTVNALNLPVQQALNFPAAILRPPFFDPKAPAAANYGAIGSIIGHEISHSFDDQGAQFGANGQLTDWWTDADRRHFEAAGAQLVAQYNAYQPLPGLHVNGKLTLSENLADLAGLSATHDAWLQSLGKKPAPAVQGLNGEQQFFLAYNRAWRGKIREPALRKQIITDAHAPEKYRGETVRNLDAWYPAFDVKPGQTLYLSPKDRVRVW